MICGLCRQKKGVKRAADGKVCKACFGHIPSIIRKDLRSYALGELRTMIEYGQSSELSSFYPTASYGNLEIDEQHGLLGIRVPEFFKSGYPQVSVFHILDLSEVALYCTSPKARRSSVVCDAEFRCAVESLGIYYKGTIKRSVKCRFRRINSSEIEWQQPGDLCVFRDMIEQMWNSEVRKMQGSYRKPPEDPKALERIRAMSMFMLEEGYTQEELKKRYHILLKAFHPDTSGENDECVKKIIEYYKLLDGKGL